jgi:UDP-3-O-[3-hydroxymyristoyl] N-acetylglucosamine deacetylase
MYLFRRSILQSASVEGIGIHSGLPVRMTLRPAACFSGIRFFRLDLDKVEVPVSPCYLAHTHRATALCKDNIRILTPEHIMAALAALGITDINIDITAEELPIADGSAKPFLDLLHTCKPVNFDAPVVPIRLHQPIFIQEGDARIDVIPSETMRFSYHYEALNSWVGTQDMSLSDLDDFDSEISSARTFGFLHEIEALKLAGLAKGGSLDTALVIGEDNYINTPRFDNECARHKLLDLMGDLWVLGRPILGDIRASKSGHATSMKLILELEKLI